MAIASIGSIAAEPVSGSANALGQEDFMKILLTQLTYQDPLKPLDNQEFIAQLAQFTSLEQTRQLNARVESLLSVQSVTQAVGLLNKTVEITGATGNAIGEVTTLRFVDGQPRLTIQTAEGAFVTDVSPARVSVVR
ncbi:flagellar hook assembly protein FlgD [Lacisediminimonas sp.]|uniref:flagellar hook assembly protein FlgD n=1 Tax=Lacisediminimonas sp. TaxID=3060582 RepID=UPI002719AFE7|nr:flagellar hook capping FlgD N-terminal domain-containing protein [Lacisediminimonas sp.]MDO8299551.1 flagellar hook capping FlgD N-terminal domain-containing protein [Lacisediminimonas sp.]